MTLLLLSYNGYLYGHKNSELIAEVSVPAGGPVSIRIPINADLGGPSQCIHRFVCSILKTVRGASRGSAQCSDISNRGLDTLTVTKYATLVNPRR